MNWQISTSCIRRNFRVEQVPFLSCLYEIFVFCVSHILFKPRLVQVSSCVSTVLFRRYKRHDSHHRRIRNTRLRNRFHALFIEISRKLHQSLITSYKNLTPFTGEFNYFPTLPWKPLMTCPSSSRLDDRKWFAGGAPAGMEILWEQDRRKLFLSD